MAEAAALALAARIASVINLQRSNYLSDNDSSVKFFNSTDLSAPPDWRIKAITQDFINTNGANQTKVFKNARDMNRLAHGSSKEAQRLLSSASSSNFFYLHTCCSWMSQCPVKEALNTVNLEPFGLLSLCCT
jgi:hypothetical protein